MDLTGNPNIAFNISHRLLEDTVHGQWLLAVVGGLGSYDHVYVCVHDSGSKASQEDYTHKVAEKIEILNSGCLRQYLTPQLSPTF